MEYLPAVARRLHHSRELGEPFDFLTWFEYAPEHADAFEELGPPTAQHGGVAVPRAGSRYPREPITGRLLFRIALSRNVRFGS
jgi:hypothetical protein